MSWVRVDDLDGTTNDVQQVTFGVNGKAYTIDLGPAAREALQGDLAPYLEVAAPYGTMPSPTPVISPLPPPKAAPAGGKRAPGAATTAERTWARENGYEISDRGRVPEHVHEAYRNRVIDIRDQR